MNMSEHRLTEEGKKYLLDGLPEMNLLSLVSGGPVLFSEAAKKVQNFNIAIQWAKSRKLIEVRNGMIHAAVNRADFPEHSALLKVERGEPVPEEIMNILMERKLVEKISHEVEELGKKLKGSYIVQLTPEMIKTGAWKLAKGFAPCERGRIPQIKRIQGKMHPYTQVVKDLREKLVGLGFVEARGPYVESEFWNFDALFMPQDHPGRGMHDAFSIRGDLLSQIRDKDLWDRVKATHEFGWITGSKGWGKWSASIARKLVLRSQMTAVSARSLARIDGKIPFKMFALDRVFRHDVVDAKHLPDFDQCEGIIAGENLNFRHLIGYLKEIGRVMGADDVRVKPSYFPFTEPSAEIYVNIDSLGWVEVGGAGILRPEVTTPLGVEVPVLAFGFGIGRLAMIKTNISDIRSIYSQDIKWLREAAI
jgi:phenylalanyl-tRNA synthetase alpha chain